MQIQILYDSEIPLTGTHQRDALPCVIREVNDAVSGERSGNN